MGLFKLEKTPKNDYIISTDYDTIKAYKITLPSGMSYDLLAGHLYGNTCADYYRMLRDVYGAELWKGPTCWFTARFQKITPELEELMKKLNREANAAWRRQVNEARRKEKGQQ